MRGAEGVVASHRIGPGGGDDELPVTYPAIRAGRAGTIDFAGIAAAGAPLGRNADTGRGELPTALSVANWPASGSVVTRERSKMTPGMAAV